MAVNANSTLRPLLALVSMKGTPYSCGMRHSGVRNGTKDVPRGSQGVIFEDKETRSVSRNLEEQIRRKARARQGKKTKCSPGVFWVRQSPGGYFLCTSSGTSPTLASFSPSSLFTTLSWAESTCNRNGREPFVVIWKVTSRYLPSPYALPGSPARGSSVGGRGGSGKALGAGSPCFPVT